MDKDHLLAELEETRVIAVVRTDRADDMPDVIGALVEGGVRFVEITMTVPGALEIITTNAKLFDGRAFVGAGTVLDSETARAVTSSGAVFAVSPIFNAGMVRFCNRHGILVMPGAFSPTEVLTAWEGGADVVKVFPARIGGPKYFRDLKGPLPQVRILPTGGVNLQTAPEFIKAGAIGIGIGTALIDPAALEKRDFDRILKNARQLVAELIEAGRR